MGEACMAGLPSLATDALADGLDAPAPRRWVMLASEQYALPILRPLAAQAQARGHRVAWLAPDAVAAGLRADEPRLCSGRALWRFRPHAVFSTVNRIPPFLPGLQVQLFHGLNLHKRDPRAGQFRMLGLFDLYCAHGPATTGPDRCRHWPGSGAISAWSRPGGRSWIPCLPGPARRHTHCAQLPLAGRR
jgi:hypothetical protein